MLAKPVFSLHRHALAVAALALLALSAGAYASGDEESPPKPNCPKGQVWDTKAKACVSQQSKLVPDSDRTRYAYRLAKAGRYQEALSLLDTLEQPNTAQALNYRGYATRKLGRTDEGIGYYLQSVALDPQYVRVREYLGEAYVIKGQLDLAKDQLQTIRSLCNIHCEEYRDLSEAIEHAEKT